MENRKIGYRPNELAQSLGVSRAGLWLLIKNGELKTTKLSARTTIILADEVERFLASKQGGVQTAVENVDAVSPSLAGHGHTKTKRFIELQSGGAI